MHREDRPLIYALAHADAHFVQPTSPTYKTGTRGKKQHGSTKLESSTHA